MTLTWKDSACVYCHKPKIMLFAPIDQHHPPLQLSIQTDEPENITEFSEKYDFYSVAYAAINEEIIPP